MQRYEISAKRSKVYTWEEAKALMIKGKVMCGEWVDNGPPNFYKIECGRLYYTNDFEYEWIPVPEKARTYKKFQWYRARLSRPTIKVQPYHIRTKVYQRLIKAKSYQWVNITYEINGIVTKVQTPKKDLRFCKDSIEYDLKSEFYKNCYVGTRVIPMSWVTKLKVKRC